jgi:acetolactate synthase-1/2/3 large subunit
MGKIYGGHLVARYLKQVEGVDTVFGLSGGHIDRIFDGFYEYGVRLIDVRHEQAAVMMAHAWSIYKNEPGVCIVTAGPGFTNSLTGLVNAHMENAPVVMLSGMSPIRDREKGALQDMSQADMVKSVVKWHGICHDTKRIPEYISKAFRVAMSGRPGPVFLELPPDILNVQVNEDDITCPQKACKSYKSMADPEAVKEAADMINSASKPLLVGGSGVAFSGCDKELKEFIDKTGIPFVLMNNGRGTLPDEHPLSIWDGGQMALLSSLPMADLVIVLGLRFNWLMFFGAGFAAAKVVRVDVEPSELDRNRCCDVGLAGDIALTLRELNRLVHKKDRGAWMKSLRDSYLPLSADEIAQREKVTDPIHPVRLMEQVRKTVPGSPIYIVDGGDASYFGLTGLRAKEKSAIIGGAAGLFGCLGTGIPMGIGAKVACPDKTVVVISGDGSFGLNAMEFDTAVRHNIPFVCVIVNDQAWGMIKHGQEINYGPKRLVGSELGVVHYEEVVKALGGHGEFVTKDDQIIPALKRALDSGKPACVNVLTDPTVTSPGTLLLVDGLKME